MADKSKGRRTDKTEPGKASQKMKTKIIKKGYEVPPPPRKPPKKSHK